MARTAAPRSPRRRRSDGERSRAAILSEAARLATVEGLNGLTISRLAQAAGMSKSGLFAHFGSKEELQLATIDGAEDVFIEQVIEPADAAPTAFERLRLLAEHFLQHVERGVYPGGCFFASGAMELAVQSGPVRDRVLEVNNDFVERIRVAANEAQAEGSIAASEDADQLAFELVSYLVAANMHFGISHDPAVMERARRALAWRLDAAAA